jgi:cell division protein FtsW
MRNLAFHTTSNRHATIHGKASHGKRVQKKHFDLLLFFGVIILTLFGLFMIYDASSVIAYRDFGDKYHYMKEQAVWIVLGFVGMLFFSYFDYHRFYKFALPLLITAIGILVLVFIPGIGVHALGANRWINLGFTTLQPAEFVKLSLAIYLAAWFSTKEKERLMAFLLLIGTIWLLVMLQPDMGTASIIAAEAMMVYFLSGGPIRHFLMLAPVAGVIGFFFIIIQPYRMARLTSFLKADANLEQTSYHVKQILIALGSGGVFGVGVGNSLQKYAYLPENVTDSIFAIYAEEFGFVGAIVLVLFFMFLIWRGFYIALHAKDMFGRLLAGGIIAFLGIQAVINLGAMSVLFPLTGVPLPFISYGGSALIVDLCAIGIMLNISKQGEK